MAIVIGVAKETGRYEHRVGLTPFAAGVLVGDGHQVVVERGAGAAAHFADEDYERAGARIVYAAEEVYHRANLICRVGPVHDGEVALLQPGTTLVGFLHLAVQPPGRVEALGARGVTLIGYEVIADDLGELPVLKPMSEMAGQMAVHIAAHYLQNQPGGRGILLGTVPGVPPPTVLILGAGTVGRAAARQALSGGAHVIVIDLSLKKLEAIHRELGARVVTVVAGLDRLERYTSFADAVVGAVLLPGARAPFLVTETMVRGMKAGSVVVDISIDQGGCIETSRPTDLGAPVFTAHDVLHYCVPNLTANIARTASRALQSAALPYLRALAGKGPREAVAADPGLAAGVYLWRGELCNAASGRSLGLGARPLGELLAREEGR